jgi:hypothetical protein
LSVCSRIASNYPTISVSSDAALGLIGVLS